MVPAATSSVLAAWFVPVRPACFKRCVVCRTHGVSPSRDYGTDPSDPSPIYRNRSTIGFISSPIPSVYWAGLTARTNRTNGRVGEVGGCRRRRRARPRRGRRTAVGAPPDRQSGPAARVMEVGHPSAETPQEHSHHRKLRHPPAAGGGDPTATDEATRIFEAECETLASTSGTAGENADRLSSSPTRTDRSLRGYPGAGTGSSAALRRHRPALRAGGCPPGRDRSPAVPTCRTRGVE